MFLSRDMAFCRSIRAHCTNISHLPGEAIRVRKYIHLIHSPRCNEIEYVSTFARVPFISTFLFFGCSPLSFQPPFSFPLLVFLSFIPLQTVHPPLSLSLYPFIAFLSLWVTQTTRQPASQTRRLAERASFRETDGSSNYYYEGTVPATTSNYISRN